MTPCSTIKANITFEVKKLHKQQNLNLKPFLEAQADIK